MKFRSLFFPSCLLLVLGFLRVCRFSTDRSFWRLIDRELLDKSQYQLAVKACLEAADYFRSVKNRNDEGTALNNLDGAYQFQGQYAKAIELNITPLLGTVYLVGNGF